MRLSKSFEYELVKARAQSLLMYDRHKSSILIVLGRNEYRQKNYAAAERYYLDAISINQNDAAAWHWLAKSTDKARGPENAIVQYEKAYELEKDAESIAEDYAMALMKVGRPQDAAEIYKSLVEMEEHNIEYVLQWATALIQAGSTDSSQAVVERLWTGMSDPLLRQKKVNKKEWSIFYKGETIALKNYSEKEKFVCTLPGAGNHEICLKSV
ncbi:MAG: hypothetical protein DHS20C01_14060 [marine bacterium B5-7]|nr:MAG: hypothetical protein DHS20C01_14060 [marine bacterium B5-7]